MERPLYMPVWYTQVKEDREIFLWQRRTLKWIKDQLFQQLLCGRLCPLLGSGLTATLWWLWILNWSPGQPSAALSKFQEHQLWQLHWKQNGIQTKAADFQGTFLLTIIGKSFPKTDSVSAILLELGVQGLSGTVAKYSSTTLWWWWWVCSCLGPTPHMIPAHYWPLQWNLHLLKVWCGLHSSSHTVFPMNNLYPGTLRALNSNVLTHW